MTTEDNIIFAVYICHLRRNNCTHLRKCVANITVWQCRWSIITNLPMRWYNAPLYFMGPRFMMHLMV